MTATVPADWPYREPDYERVFADAKKAGAKAAYDLNRRIMEATPSAPSGGTTYTTSPGPGAWQTPDVEWLAGKAREFEADRKAANASLVSALAKVIGDSGRGADVWAARLGVDPFELLEVLAGRREPDGRFWDRVRVTFEPFRGRTAVHVSELLAVPAHLLTGPAGNHYAAARQDHDRFRRAIGVGADA